ncbi:MAG TPA: SBBP repeat-containing protein [Bacteroidia bacterium]|nr:SBBP repeat-containing protein [Bacteroidia bacterium]
MKKTILITACLILGASYVSAQSWLWGKMGKDNYFLEAIGAASDVVGDAYLTGWFKDTITFGSNKLTTLGHDFYLVKYDSLGNIKWISRSRLASNHSSAGDYTDVPIVATDNFGNEYVTGGFVDTVYFGTDTLKKKTYYEDVYLVKYNKNGNVIWARQSTCSYLYSTAQGSSVATDNSGNIYITGYFDDTISFGSNTLVTRNINLHGVFLVKYDSNGNVSWAKQGHCPSLISGALSSGVTTDKNGNSYITGYFEDTVSFGAYNLRAAKEQYSQAAFLVKFDANGNVLWAKQSKTISDTSHVEGFSVITDKVGGVYITGFFSDTIVFGKDTLKNSTQKRQNYGEIFLVKYDTNGNEIWAKQSYDTITVYSYGWSGWSLAADSLNRIYLSCGSLAPGTGKMIFLKDTFLLTSADYEPSLVMQLDTAGNTICNSMIVAGGDDQNTVAVSPSGKYIYLGGDIKTTAVFGSDTLSQFKGNESPFIARWQPCGNNILTDVNNLQSKNISISVYPNPFTFTTNIVFNSIGEHYLELDDIAGRKIETIECSGAQYELHRNNFASGIYFIRVSDSDDGTFFVKKLILQ